MLMHVVPICMVCAFELAEDYYVSDEDFYVVIPRVVETPRVLSEKRDSGYVRGDRR